MAVKTNYIYLTNFKSKSNPEKSYQVKRNKISGEVSCNCPGWIFKRQGKIRSCRHTKLVNAKLMLQTASFGGGK